MVRIRTKSRWLSSHQALLTRSINNKARGASRRNSDSVSNLWTSNSINLGSSTSKSTCERQQLSTIPTISPSQTRNHPGRNRSTRPFLSQSLLLESRLAAPSSSSSSSTWQVSKRFYKDYLRTVSLSDINTSNPTIRKGRIPLRSNSTHGQSSTRGIRPTQEDTSSVACLSLPHEELRNSYLKSRSRIAKEAVREWKGQRLTGITAQNGQGNHTFTVQEAEGLAGQIAWFAVFDGHGGSKISKYLSENLHSIFETVSPNMITDVIQQTRNHGGYFRRFNGGILERWVVKEELKALRGGRGNPIGREKLLEKERNKGFDKGMQDLVEGIEKDPDGDKIHGRGEDAFLAEKVALKGEEDASASTVATTTTTATTAAAESDHRIQNSNESQTASLHSNASNPSSPATPSPAGKPQSKAGNQRPSSSGSTSRKALDDLIRKIDVPKGMEEDTMTIAERATLACLVADRQIQSDENLNIGGSTASIALLHSLDSPPQPWYSSKIISVTSVHIGDTRILLCPVSDGSAIPLTNYHHPDDRSESERLRKMGAGMITDSFGEARWMGALANTRAFGDSQYKKLGVTAEPEIISQILKGDDHAFIIAFSDGIGGVLSDQEIIDLCREAKHPQDATKAVLNFAEELGSDDNCTVLCVPLKGWGKIGGIDRTKAEREKRRSQVDVFRDNRQ